jgi:hypothetical protein
MRDDGVLTRDWETTRLFPAFRVLVVTALGALFVNVWLAQ